MFCHRYKRLTALGGMKVAGFDIQQEIGKGGFGKVSLAKKNGKFYAAKQILPNRDGAIDEMGKSLLIPLHRNIIEIEEIHFDVPILWIFMKYCNLGDIVKFFCMHSPISINKRFNMINQIAIAVKFLHETRIIHRDLKPENILVEGTSDNFTLKISDFGLSKFLKEGETSQMSTNVGTRWYKAPEFSEPDLDGKITYRKAVDIYAMGLVFMSIMQDGIQSGDPRPIPEGSFYQSELNQPIGETFFARNKNKQPIPVVINNQL